AKCNYDAVGANLITCLSGWPERLLFCFLVVEKERCFRRTIRVALRSQHFLQSTEISDYKGAWSDAIIGKFYIHSSCNRHGKPLLLKDDRFQNAPPRKFQRRSSQSFVSG